ncbi:membrane protein [Lysinibacillus sp. BF-4]|uniref:CcdC family protein n=2 Tax=Bacillales TaxID=1385 RepID=UPI000500996C|nr:cytochrome c biogenesis protein CcdC [Lysinibacillus sp. BF-4]KFL43736.1 membrane protein [Lysinibacillus sp. BF-4]
MPAFLQQIPSQYLIIGSTIMAVVMGIFVTVMRMRAANHPVSAKKIIIPPIAMSTGALMFISPYFRVPLPQVFEAAVVGALFSIVLIMTSKFEVRGNDIFMKRSKAFIFILVALLLIRLVAKSVLSTSIDVGELGGMFWILAFFMILPWRVAMLVQYKRLEKVVKTSSAT